MKERLRLLQADDDRIGDVRGRGAMIAVELVRAGSSEPDPAARPGGRRGRPPAGRHRAHLRDLGNVLRFLPPLTISDALLTDGLDVLAGALEETR